MECIAKLFYNSFKSQPHFVGYKTKCVKLKFKNKNNGSIPKTNFDFQQNYYFMALKSLITNMSI